MPRPTPLKLTDPVRLILIDHLPVFRDSLRQVIYQGKNLKVVGEGDRARDVYNGKVSIDADVAVVDLDLPDCSGFEVCQWLAAHNQRLAVLCLSYWDWDSYVVGARAVGAKGMLMRTTPTQELVQSIERSALGAIFTRDQIKRIQKWDESFGATFRSFRPREWQVFWLAADGLGNHAIAVKLDLSENTVEKLMTVILEKFNLSSRSQLLAIVYNQHLDVLRCIENNRLLTFP